MYEKALHLMYEKAKKRAPDDIAVDGRLHILIHKEVEDFRAARIRPFVQQFGHVFHKSEFHEASCRKRDPESRCYDNALITAVEYGLIYCEGVLVFQTPHHGEVCLAHGWCCDKQGSIIDPTCWLYQNHPKVEYEGIAIKTNYAVRWFQRNGYAGLLDGVLNEPEAGIYYDSPDEFLQEIG
jgi:hypothetical protein